ncbi:predicted protein [Sclerotinia sclerotiorum 1980 UF-70]|uniref:Myb-like DNA-binding domain-containing protein n=2 Tax=Sclerotinia sclerotiorum (strain ATCC 18683 / 1980 / Ss-1) TaxID=665079 RepID=A7E9V3_SCLS1|nr:predicted protein [Sclerotinia sclerotiorum 1980 UF-70]APA05600.1 hypothetical protein sscle_01g003700 [Sclerotinia sclerotiorum 1980 UF-70]EDN97155.1 predicted protein [Sclerotinia sclerotiorum 1980 UF-70]
MSDNEAASTPAQANGGMSQVEVDFLMCCLRNTTGGSIQVDTQKVAQLLNYKNPRSVSNKVSSIKKKYNLPFGASSRTAEEMAVSKPGKGDASPKKASDANGDNEPAVPTTPSKNRVTKTKAIPKPRVKKTPAKKPTKKVAAEESQEEELSDVEDEEMEDAKEEDDE